MQDPNNDDGQPVDRSVKRDKEALRLMKWAGLAWAFYIPTFVWHVANALTPGIISLLYIVTTGVVLVTNVRLALHFRHNGRWH